MREREQRSQQWAGIGLGEAVRCEGLLEFGQLRLGRVVRGKLQEPLQVLDEGIEGTVLVIGRAAKLDPGGAFGTGLLFMSRLGDASRRK